MCMIASRILVAIMLIAIAAPIGGAIYILGAESVTSGATGATTFLVVLFVLIWIARGMWRRERTSTAYW